MAIDWRRVLLDKIEARELRVGIIGLGYVGLPLAVEFAKAGLTVVGIDVDEAKVAQLNAGVSYIADVPTSEVAELTASGKLSGTTDFSVIASLDAISICVPTPLRKTKDPDITFVVGAAEKVGRYAHPGMIVVLESTTYPGTTEELVLPRLRERGLTPGQDVFVAFSPERVDPGNAVYSIHNTPKVIGGFTPVGTELAGALYGTAIQTIVPVSNPAAAEMVKLLENTFRAVNIALVNEVAIMCGHLGLDVWEIIDAAATKPFGYMKFTPGPGLGGHCIPIDPLYLSWKLRELRYEARFIGLADTINSDMPRFVVTKIADALNDDSKPIKGAKITILGAAYKADVEDVRESPALDIIEMLHARGAALSLVDPHVENVRLDGFSLASVPLSAELLADSDCVVIVTAHKAFDWDLIGGAAHLIVDTRNALAKVSDPAAVTARVVKL